MHRPKLLGAFLLAALTLSSTTLAQERGSWRAASNTAKSITGDVGFSGEKISINFAAFTIAQIRTLTPAEIGAAFDADTSAGGIGNLYRTQIPAGRKFLHNNTLCGGDDAQWVATYVLGKTLQLAIFSGPQMPTLTPEALTSSSNLCGTFTYVH